MTEFECKLSGEKWRPPHDFIRLTRATSFTWHRLRAICNTYRSLTELHCATQELI